MGDHHRFDTTGEDRKHFENHLQAAKNFIEIALALSSEKDLHTLLEMIVTEALRISNADAGTLYTADSGITHLDFVIVRNRTLGIRLGGKSGDRIELPSVPLFDKNGDPDHSHISSYAALTGKTVNIEDVYKATEFNFSGTKSYDRKTGYRSESMLVIPMYNYENDILGVLQLINAIDPFTGHVTSFDRSLTEAVSALSSLASAALNNTRLIFDLQNLFYAFIKSIAAAIDAKSPYTGGHINRVVELTMMIAHEVNRDKSGPFKDIFFSTDDFEEMKIAAWMHDIGKITTPEFIINKRSKLETVTDRIETIRTRFDLIRQTGETRYLEQRLALLQKGEPDDGKAVSDLQRKRDRQIKEIKNDFDFLCRCNEGNSVMDDGSLERLRNIRAKTFVFEGKHLPYLTDSEFDNLSVKKGTLTVDERKRVEDHVVITRKILEELPFPKKLKGVPSVAAAHHEKLDGSGYPDGKTGAELNIKMRIMTLADVFEALTARDRPYKYAARISRAIAILDTMQKDRHIDKNIFRLFKENELFRKYAEKYLDPEQIDM